MKWFIVILSLLSTLSLIGQEVKTEIETRIKGDQIPQNSLNWVETTFPERKRLKWYSENNNNKMTFEAKFKYSGSRYSVEFDKEGSIEDVEVNVKLKDIQEDISGAISKTLNNFEKYRIVKIQEQWTAKSSDLLQKALIEQNKSLATIRYEIEFRAIIEGIDGFWEGLFDTKGALLQRSRIALRPTDNLDF